MDKITLILGAGASYDYGFPTGLELTEMIGNPHLNKQIFNDLDGLSSESTRISFQNGIKKIDQHFFKSRNISIDSWLARPENKEFESAGKLLITHYISQKERYQFDRTGFFSKMYKSNSKDWYRELFNQLLTDNFEEFPKTENNLAVITFNYDISLEYFLLIALHNTYIGHSLEECWDKIKNIEILHVYGSIGELPLSNSERSQHFGKTPIIQETKQRIIALINRSKKIKIIPEIRNENSEDIARIKGRLAKSDKIYFVGFSYDPLNLQLLGFPLISEQYSVDIYGTVLGLEEGEIYNATRRVIVNTKSVGKNLNPVDCDAYTFFKREIIKSFI